MNSSVWGVWAVKKNECFLVTFEAGFIRQLYIPTLYRTRDLGIVSCTSMIIKIDMPEINMHHTR